MWLFHVRCSRKNVWCCTARRNELCAISAWVLQPFVAIYNLDKTACVTWFGGQVDGLVRDAGTGFRGSASTREAPKTSGSGARLLAKSCGARCAGEA